MDQTEKDIRLETLDIALEDINKIIDTMEEKCYPKEQMQDYYAKRWELYNEIYKTKKA
jgi:hypothetical protein